MDILRHSDSDPQTLRWIDSTDGQVSGVTLNFGLAPPPFSRTQHVRLVGSLSWRLAAREV